jgi:hypothetical protein
MGRSDQEKLLAIGGDIVFGAEGWDSAATVIRCLEELHRLVVIEVVIGFDGNDMSFPSGAR